MSELTVRLPRKRHLRKSAFVRTARSKYLRRYIDLKADDLDATGSTIVADFTVDVAVVDSVAHGLSVGEGPFIIDDDGVTGDAVFVWVKSVPDVDTFTLATKRGPDQPDFIPGATETGIDMIKADGSAAVYEYLRQNRPEVVDAATSVDDL